MSKAMTVRGRARCLALAGALMGLGAAAVLAVPRRRKEPAA